MIRLFSFMSIAMGLCTWLATNSHNVVGDDHYKCNPPVEMCYPSVGGYTTCNRPTNGDCAGLCEGYSQWTSPSPAGCIPNSGTSCINPDGMITITIHRVTVFCGAPAGNPTGCQCVFTPLTGYPPSTSTVPNCFTGPLIGG